MDFLLDFILHVDQYMIDIVQEYHTWAYVILFLIIFCETGLVVTPFLPGDSLLFVAGAIAALPDMLVEVNVLVLILFAAAVLGDSCNYMIGYFFGRKLFRIPGYSSRATLRKHMSFIKSMAVRLLSLHALCPLSVHLPHLWREWVKCTITISCCTI